MFKMSINQFNEDDKKFIFAEIASMYISKIPDYTIGTGNLPTKTEVVATISDVADCSVDLAKDLFDLATLDTHSLESLIGVGLVIEGLDIVPGPGLKTDRSYSLHQARLYQQ